MKITAYILSMYVLFLVGLPILKMVEVFHEEICCIGDHDEHQEDEGEGCDEVCNPFLSCHCCSAFLTVGPNHIYRSHHYSQNSRIKHFFPSPVVFAVWHPPRA